MRKLAIALGALVAVLGGLNVFQAIPAPAPSKPVFVQRVETMMHALERADWKAACAVAPTATVALAQFEQVAQINHLYGVQNEKLCERVFSGTIEDDNGKARPVKWKVDYWTASRLPGGTYDSAQTVILELKIGTDANQTFDVTVGLSRIPWGPTNASMRWYVLEAS